MKILFDLLPVILFFGTFKLSEKTPELAIGMLGSLGLEQVASAQAPILLATLVVILATAGQILWVWSRHGKVDRMLWISLTLVVVLGGLTVALRNDNFIKWKPTILYWVMGLGMLVAQVFGKSPLKGMLGEKLVLPEALWQKLNRVWGGFFLLLGGLNLYVAYHFETDTWVNFKLFGLTGLLFIFIIAQGFFLSAHLTELPDQQGNT